MRISIRHGQKIRSVKRVLVIGIPKKCEQECRWLGGKFIRALIAIVMLTLNTVVVAQIPDLTNESNRENAAARPSLDELLQAFAVQEKNYLPFYVKSIETFRMGDGLTAKEKRPYPWADGSKHQKLMEYGQLDQGVWVRKETMLKDKKVQAHFDVYNNFDRQIKVSNRPDSDEGLQVHLEYGEYRAKIVFSTPLAGLFPLSVHSNGTLLSEAVKMKQTQISLRWDGSDAVLDFKFGPENRPIRYALWLSQKHAWHPIKLQRFSSETSKQFFSEWEATQLKKDRDIWRVTKGTHKFRNYDETEIEGAKVMYSTDFVILNSEYNNTVEASRFEYKIPTHAEVHDPRQEKKVKPPGNLRKVEVLVVDLNDQPVPNATVRFGDLQGEETDSATTDAKGIARTEKAPEDVSIDVTANNFRDADWILGGHSNDFRVIMSPITKGIAITDSGTPIKDVWITSKTINFRANGEVYIPRHESAPRDNDWSDVDGNFKLDSVLSLRNLENPVLIAAVDDSANHMAFDFVAPKDLSKSLTVTMRPTVLVKGTCVFEGVSQEAEVSARILDDLDRNIAHVTSTCYIDGNATHAAFQFRLPVGKYHLDGQSSNTYPAFSVSIEVKDHQSIADFGTVSVAATGLAALTGIPSPALKVKYRAGEESSIEQMKGNVVVLCFWVEWHPSLAEQLRPVMRVVEEFKDHPVKWLAISSPRIPTFPELDAKLKEFEGQVWNGQKMNLQTVIDLPDGDGDRVGQTAKSFSIQNRPISVLIDREGKVVGAVHRSVLAERLRDLLSE